MTIKIGNNPKTTLWKLNSSLLNIPQVKVDLEKEIKTYFNENNNGEVSFPIVWDAFKAVLRGKIISISSSLKKQRQEKLSSLQTKLKELQKDHKSRPGTNQVVTIKKIQNEINEIYSEEVKKKLVFLKQGHYEAGSKAMKLLSYKLRKQQADATINKIRCPQTKKIQYRLDQIQQSFENYYKELYSQPKLDNEEGMMSFLDSLNLPTITEGQNKALTANITEKEVKAAISRLKPHKSPGSDGFTAKWYKSFREQLTSQLCQLCNGALKDGKIPPSWKQAIISVIPKEGKDSLDCRQF